MLMSNVIFAMKNYKTKIIQVMTDELIENIVVNSTQTWSNYVNSMITKIQILNSNLISKNNIKISNNLNQTQRYAAYIELYFKMPGQTGNEVTLYNSFVNNSLKNVANVMSANQLVIPFSSPQYTSYAGSNDNRFFTSDMVITLNTPIGAGPDYLYFDFIDNSNLKFAIAKCVSFIYQPSGPYSPIQVNRYNIWVYYPYTQVYMLINSSDTRNSYGFSIWIMQGYTTQKYPVTIDLLPLLNTYLTNTDIVGSDTPPSNWSYSYTNLGINTFLNVTAIGEAYIIQDGLNNTYQYLDPTYCNFLYENISYNNQQST